MGRAIVISPNWTWHDDRVPSEQQLQMIQSVISRLAGQSTTVKGWCITVTAALLGFGSAASPIAPAIALYVIVAFAVLDSYYLSLERAYRHLFAVTATRDPSDWTLEVGRPSASAVMRALRSPSIFLVYGTSLVAAAAVCLYTALR
jgi:hypothetical protein